MAAARVPEIISDPEFLQTGSVHEDDPGRDGDLGSADVEFPDERFDLGQHSGDIRHDDAVGGHREGCAAAVAQERLRGGQQVGGGRVAHVKHPGLEGFNVFAPVQVLNVVHPEYAVFQLVRGQPVRIENDAKGFVPGLVPDIGRHDAGYVGPGDDGDARELRECEEHVPEGSGDEGGGDARFPGRCCSTCRASIAGVAAPAR